MQQFMSAIGRKCSVVNLDPGNDRLSYPCAINVMDMIALPEIMTDEHLGPNGATLLALETIEANIGWLTSRLQRLGGVRRVCDEAHTLQTTMCYLTALDRSSYSLTTHHSAIL